MFFYLNANNVKTLHKIFLFFLLLAKDKYNFFVFVGIAPSFFAFSSVLTKFLCFSMLT